MLAATWLAAALNGAQNAESAFATSAIFSHCSNKKRNIQKALI
jgi:hypothetical protein